MANKFRIPEVTFMGEGALEAAEKDIAILGKKAFIVSGKSMICLKGIMWIAQYSRTSPESLQIK